MKRLGERIRKKREMHKYQLNELAKRVGISASALSQIENAKAFPSIVTLKSIADNLHSTVGELIGENEMLTHNPLITVDERKFVRKNKSGSKLYLLSHHDSHKQMETYLVHFSDSSNVDGFFSPHPGQVFCYVISGTFQFILDEEEYSLHPGDSFYFNAPVPNQVKLDQASEGELIWIESPPPELS